MKTKFVLNFTIISLVMVLVGCAGLGDYTIKLTNKYDVIRLSANQVVIAKENGESSWGENVVPGKVVEVGYDKKFIVAKQLGLQPSPDNPNGVAHYSKVGYWILDVENEKTFGPLSEEDFKSKKDELGVSNKVILKSLDDYKQEH